MSLHSRKDTRRRIAALTRSAISTATEYAEQRVLLSAASIDGTGNNVKNSEWGSTEEAMLRLADAEYADAISAVGGEHRPSARLISNVVSDSSGETVISDRLMSAMIYTWGQFIDHDMTLTKSGITEKMSIPVPIGDPSFDPLSTGTKTIDTMRSAFDESTGTKASNPRQHVNLITAFLDGSMVYGSDAVTAASLRTFSGGTMKTSEGDLLPVGPGGMFQAGDIRVNENPGLISLQTLFVREHNYQAKKIASGNKNLTDEQVYQKARSIVAAEIQAITYNEWLPSMLGREAIDKYTGYDATINPGISNEFATAAFRFGHSLLGDEVEFFDNNGLPIREGVPLSQAFFNPALVTDNGIDSVLKYLSADPSSEVDTEVVDGVRNFLFGPPGAGGLDLASLNIQRGRDHGLADYNSTRAAIGLKKITSFAEITFDKDLQAKLESLYGTVDDIDLWVGGLAEVHVRGSSVGETFQTIIVEQFKRLRDGDRFWFQNQFSGKQLMQLQRTSLSDVIGRNTDLTSVQHNAFIFKAGIAGVVTSDINRDRRSDRNEPPLPKIQVQLISVEDDSVVATTTTNQRGEYRFGVADGLRTGHYEVRASRPDGTTMITSGKVSVTGGDDFERVNLAVPVPPKPDGPQTRPPKQNSPPPARSIMNNQASTKPGIASSKDLVKNSVALTAADTNRSMNSMTIAAAKKAEKKLSPTISTSLFAALQSTSVNSMLTVIDSLFETMPHGLL